MKEIFSEKKYNGLNFSEFQTALSMFVASIIGILYVENNVFMACSIDVRYVNFPTYLTALGIWVFFTVCFLVTICLIEACFN